jgi:hypothetical protein
MACVYTQHTHYLLVVKADVRLYNCILENISFIHFSLQTNRLGNTQFRQKEPIHSSLQLRQVVFEEEVLDAGDGRGDPPDA